MGEESKAEKPAPSGRSARSVMLAVYSVGLCVAVLVAILLTRGQFLRVFEEFDVELPALTQLVVGPVLPALLVLVIVAAIAKELIPPLAAARSKMNIALFFLAATFLAIYVVGVFLPLMEVLNGLSPEA